MEQSLRKAAPTPRPALGFGGPGRSRAEEAIVCCAISFFLGLSPAWSGQPIGTCGSTAILSAKIVRNGTVVAIRTGRGTQMLDPARGDTALAGYDHLILSPDHQTAAWVEEQGAPVSDASYPEPSGAWLYARGRLLGLAKCDKGRPFGIHFDEGGRILALMCSFPHGVSSEHEMSLDTVSGWRLFSRGKPAGRKRHLRGSISDAPRPSAECTGDL